jgi:hypothetical protein
VRIPGTLNKVPYVKICSNYGLFCQDCKHAATMNCPNYHVYIRPSTRDLILKIYPLQHGVKARDYKSGARHEGHVKGSKLNGYGVMHWGSTKPSNHRHHHHSHGQHGGGRENTNASPTSRGKSSPKKTVLNNNNNAVQPISPSTYIGDFKDDLRHGLGIFRSLQYEYVGMWERGMKHGWGTCITANEEEYTGDWVDGHMEGVGMLCNYRTGEAYVGEFKKSKYHGLGKFVNKNGDSYLGYSENGKYPPSRCS